MVIKILVVSDLHCGGIFGLLPTNYYNADRDLRFIPSKLQAFLWDYWVAMVKNIGHVDKVFCNGDIVDGLNPKGKGEDILISDFVVQADIAKSCLELIDADKFYFTQGSGYHTGHNPSGDEITCKLMGGEWLNIFDTITIGGVKIHVRHHSSFSADEWNRYNSQRKDATKLKLDDNACDILIRSHTHHFNFSGDTDSLTINTACWKGLDKHCSISGGVERVDNGYVVITIKNGTYSWDHFEFKIPHNLYMKNIIE